MKYDILLCGVGGQGVLSIAAVIASSALTEGFSVRQSEVHGMSQRGGGVHAHLRISDTTIASDLIPSGQADMILSMEPLESLQYLDWLNKDGSIITAKQPFKNIPNYPDIEKVYTAIKQASHKAKIVDSANLAKEAGNTRTENMVLVGAALDAIPVSKQAVEDGIKSRFAKKDPRLVEINIKAIELGEAHK
ncbi:MAG: indolepyruvate oxidoreductase [Treponema sp. CETP13]|nr:MAG: indolepyruvate oxidoreductase [Treponema sp. CETP13]